ncbi:putative neuropeptide F-like receptor [Schistosoma mansoni]|uniref:putative neuropeptide F-like receptor n=1 Tax=Schistosoma mansoni TaxID=6183 RepID=UPI0001A635B4|nr:putative neuropeptide F-like receptor [Schistosoma mansoni]|eukprot:XP_018654055.1 putative neuropeptide F-like receptor [Schistosoma mansoni]
MNQTFTNNWVDEINPKANLSNLPIYSKSDQLPTSKAHIFPTSLQLNQPKYQTSQSLLLFDFSSDLGKTEHSSHRIPSWRNFLICIYTLLTICGATFNLILIFALLKFRKQTLSHNITNLFVLCLAVSDIFLCSVSMPIQLYYEMTENHKPSTDLCRVLFSSFGIPMYISCLTILLIAFDRYRLIVYPLKTQLTPKAAFGLIIIVILFSALNSIPVALQVNSEGVNDYHYCVESWPSPQLRFAYSVSIFVILVLLPLSASGGFYLAIYRRLKQRPCQLNASKEAEKRKRHLLWYTMNQSLPIMNENFTMNSSIDLMKPNMNIIPGRHIKIIDLLLKLFAMGSACVNPLLYGWLNEPIRVVMRRQYSRFEGCFKCFKISRRRGNNNKHMKNYVEEQNLQKRPLINISCFDKHKSTLLSSSSSKFLTPSHFIKSNSDYDTKPKLIIDRPKIGSKQLNDARSMCYTEGDTNLNNKDSLNQIILIKNIKLDSDTGILTNNSNNTVDIN